MGKQRRKFETAFKRQVVQQIEAGALTTLQVARTHQLSPSLIDRWRRQFREQKLVDRPSTRERQLEAENEKLKAKIGDLVMQNDQLKKLHDLKAVWKGSHCLLIWGEGGVGKTSLACQIAKWAMSESKYDLPFRNRMLPVLIEQDFDVEVREGQDVLIETIRGHLRELTGKTEAPSEELVRHLLRKQRILLIVDGYSELSEDSRKKIRPRDPRFGVTSLVVTSRTEEILGGSTRTTLHPMRLQHNRVASFMEVYLQQSGKRSLFTDTEFFEGCRGLSAMVADREITVLLARLYADQMVGSKERGELTSPQNIPDLMLDYLNELNRKKPELDDRAVHQAAMEVAWECLRQTFRPTPADINRVLDALGGDSAASDRYQYLELNLRLIQTVGAGRDRVKFALDPLAEYLAGLRAVAHYRDNEAEWRQFLDRTDAAAGSPEAIRGFLLAVRDCCRVKRAEFRIPEQVISELDMRVT